MLRPYFLYEPVGDASEADAGGEPVVEAGAEPAVEESVAPSVEASGEPAPMSWEGLQSNPEFQGWFQQAQEQAVESALERLLSQQPEQEEQQPELPELDPFSDDFPSQLAARDQILAQTILKGMADELGKELGPLKAAHHAQQIEKATAASQELLGTFTDLGEFNKEAAEKYADSVYDEVAAQYGPGPRSAQIALRKGAEYVKALETSAYERGQADLKAHLATIAGAPREPDASGQGAESPGQYKDELAAARAWSQRQQ